MLQSAPSPSHDSPPTTTSRHTVATKPYPSLYHNHAQHSTSHNPHPVMSTDACCICTQLFDHSDTKTEKPLRLSHRLACCNRLICDRCTSSNPRYTSYCPYCQISFQPPSEKLLPDGLRDPPPYTPAAAPSPLQKDQPPPYEAEAREDVVHFLSPGETLQSLSLAYGIPIEALRRANGVFADTLVAGRRSVVVPGAGRSLAPEPADPEGEEKRLALRRFMVATKMAE